ncbi:hypothetical protein ACFE04_015961 [Oxalis oulophora]
MAQWDNVFLSKEAVLQKARQVVIEWKQVRRPTRGDTVANRPNREREVSVEFQRVSTNYHSNWDEGLCSSMLAMLSCASLSSELNFFAGLFSMRKKIEDAVLQAESLALTAIENEEVERIKQEEMIRDYNPWDDTVKSHEILAKLADIAKVVDGLKDVKYKAEEARLITQLAESDDINYGLFEQAYDTSLYASKFLYQYEISKLLKGPYDMEGACLTIRAGSGGSTSEVWAEKLLRMYTKWAEKQGNLGRLVEEHYSTNGGIKMAMIEFEFQYAYGYLSGESGLHIKISSQNGSKHREDYSASACVEIAPMFLGAAPDTQLDDSDMIVSSPSLLGKEGRLTESSVSIQHIPTGIRAHSSGERSRFANKIKALNRLHAKLLVIAMEQGATDISSIKKEAIVDVWQKETRRYVSQPLKLVEDVQTGFQLPELTSVLDGNIEPFIGAYIKSK